MHRELVSNVLRHSQADRLAVSIELKDGRLVSRIRDNGVGGVDAQGDGSFGLRNLRRRIDELQGRVSVRDAAPGTLVEIEVPIAAAGGRQ
jgi:two-component system sensor histidine kinase DesK